MYRIGYAWLDPSVRRSPLMRRRSTHGDNPRPRGRSTMAHAIKTKSAQATTAAGAAAVAAAMASGHFEQKFKTRCSIQSVGSPSVAVIPTMMICQVASSGSTLRMHTPVFVFFLPKKDTHTRTARRARLPLLGQVPATTLAANCCATRAPIVKRW